MEKFAVYIVQKLKNGGYAPDLDEAWGVYALTVKLEQMIGFLGIIVVALVYGRIPEFILFYIVNRIIRQRAGGYHAKSFAGCFIFSIGIVICMETILIPFFLRQMHLFVITVVISILTLEIIGSVNHPNMAWNDEEYKESKRLCRIYVVLITGTLTLLIRFSRFRLLSLYGFCAVILSAILQIIAKIIGMEVRQNDPKDK